MCVLGCVLSTESHHPFNRRTRRVRRGCGRFFCNDKTSICVSDDAPYLAALLNSAAGEWFIRKTAAEKQGGFFEFKPMYASAIPIPAATPGEQAALSGLVDRILAAKRAGDAATVAALEAEIDTHVFRLYGLTDEERTLIKGTA